VIYELLRFLVDDVPFFTFIVVGAIFFAYLINPVVALLSRRMPVWASLVVVYAAIAFAVAFAIYIVWPAVASDAQSIARNAPRMMAEIQKLLTDPRDPLTAHLPATMRNFILSIPTRIERAATNYGAAIASRVIPVIVSAVAVLALFIVIPVVAAYMTAESKSIKRLMLLSLPRPSRYRAARIIQDLDRVVGGFIRGQLLVAIIVGSLITLLLLGLRVPYAVLIGVVAGALDVIPYVGAFAGWLAAFTISFVNNGVENAAAVTLGIIVINQLEGHVIVPNVVSRTVALTPLGVMLALLISGEILGLPGLLIAVPAAGLVRVLFINLVQPSRREHPQPSHRMSRLAAYVTRLIVSMPNARSRAWKGTAVRRRSTRRSP
jgi:predicted PurR-regulated permease PerM